MSDQNEYEACPHCHEEVSHRAPDAISVCNNCEVVVEGSTIMIPYPSDLASRYFIRED